MAGQNGLILKIEGSAQYNHHLEFSVFVAKIKQFLNLLKNSAKEGGATDGDFYIVSLSHSSPATIICEPIGKNIFAPTAFNSVIKNLNLVREGQTHNLSHAMLSGMEQLARYDPQKISWLEIQAVKGDEDKEIYILDDNFRENLSRARSTEERVVSTLDGKLEEVNIHGGANTFKIYSSLPHISPVTCEFSNDLLAIVQRALGRFVSVWGQCFYRPGATSPYKIHIRKMDILPPSEELPSLDDLRGIAPEATGSKSSEQFVRELRDKWHKEV